MKKLGRPRRGKRYGNHCVECFGMAHRRPKAGACACGEIYTPLPPVTLQDVLEQPRSKA